VSNYHAYVDECHAVAPTGSQTIRDLIGAMRNALVVAVSPLRKTMARRTTEDRVAGLSAHLLADLGYERDWDGSIHPVGRDNT
jgi:hypothetical protein